MRDHWITTRFEARLPTYRFSVRQRGREWIVYGPDDQRRGEFGDRRTAQRSVEAALGLPALPERAPSIIDRLRALHRCPGSDSWINGCMVRRHRYPDAPGLFEICPDPSNPARGAYWVGSVDAARDLIASLDRRSAEDEPLDPENIAAE